MRSWFYRTATPTYATILADGNMEAATTASWIANSGATLSKQTTTPYGGARCLRVQNTGGDNASQARQDILTARRRFVAEGWYRTEAGGNAQVFFGASTSVVLATATSWTFVRIERMADAVYFMLGASGVDKYAEFDNWNVRVTYV